jgi:D-aspartate ligase
MGFWKQSMPVGMLLRSPWEASHIGDPSRSLTLDHFEAAQGVRREEPIPLEFFIRYGEWFQRAAVPDVDTRHVARVDYSAQGFTLSLRDGEVVRARRVVVASGLKGHEQRPGQFAGLPAELATHASEHASLGRFKGKRIAVVGAGQSALESATILFECGAEVDVIARANAIHWTGVRPGVPTHRERIHSLLNHISPPGQIGPFPLNWIVDVPGILRLLPAPLRRSISRRALRPAGARWLIPRAASLRIRTARVVVSAIDAGDTVRLRLDDRSELRVDHVLLATGYRPDITGYPFLPDELVSQIASSDRYPVLSRGLESSIPGLYFAGAVAGASLGPLMRFVRGSNVAGARIAADMGRKVLQAGRSRSRAFLSPRVPGEPAPQAAQGPEIPSSLSARVPAVLTNLRIECRPENSVVADGEAANDVPPGVIVAGGLHGSLGIARSLGRRGVPVWVIAYGSAIQKASRYVERSCSWVGDDSSARIAYLLELAHRHGLDGWVLFAGGDDEVELFSQNRRVLSRSFRVTTPGWEVTRWAYDKRLTYRRCADLGIDHPWTKVLTGSESLREIDCKFPAILKPAYRKSRNAFTRAKAWSVRDRSDLAEKFRRARGLVEPGVILLQEMIPGGGEAQFSYSALCANGKPIATLVARRARQFPVDFGYTSTFVETVERPEVEEAASRFLRSIRYCGLAEVEFKYDERDGRYKLLDVNPRVWTWHTLGRKAGVDFPYLMCLQACGHSVPQMRARTGIRWILGFRDFVAALVEVRRSRLTATSYLRSLRPPIELGVFAFDDPLPAVAAFPGILRRLWLEVAN